MAAGGVEFAHDVVDQQNGWGAVGGGEVLGLGEFEGDGEGAFLAFAGEIGGGFVVELEAQFIAVRAEEGGAKGALSVAHAMEFGGEVFFDAGLVFDAKFFAIGGDAGVGGGDARAEFGQERAAAGHYFVTKLDHFVRETFEGGFVDGPFFEERIAGAYGAGVVLQKGQVSGQGLGEEEIKEAPAAAACAFDELEVLGAKGDGAEGAEVIGEFADGLIVEGEAALIFAPV